MRESKLLPRVCSAFRYIPQQKPDWCWAACIQMVLINQGTVGFEQSEIVSSSLLADDRNTVKSHDLRFRPKFAIDIGITLSSFGISSQFHEGLVSFDMVYKEIQANRLVMLGLEFFLSDDHALGHLIMVVGCDTNFGEPRVIVCDPMRGIGITSYASLMSAYGRGRWYCTWTDMFRCSRETSLKRVDDRDSVQGEMDS